MNILGISCFYHDSAVALVRDGVIVFAIQEERLSRVKHDNRFPIMGVAKALEAGRLAIDSIDEVVFYEDPGKKLARIFDQVVMDWPDTWELFANHLPRFFAHKHPIERILRKQLGFTRRFSTIEHHTAHAASAFYTSLFESALVLTVDGVGEYETVGVFWGKGNTLRKVRSIHFPDSLGLLYSVFTDYVGFEVNEGEYKVMGLAPYGAPVYADRIRKGIIELREAGSFVLNRKYFRFSDPRRHYTDALVSYLGIPPRKAGAPMTREYRDLAASIQQVLEEALVSMVRVLLKEFPTKNVCLSGGVALNCTANARLIRDCGIRLHIHPASGDSGGALGAAMMAAVRHVPVSSLYRFAFQPYLGVAHGAAEIETVCSVNGIKFSKPERLQEVIAAKLAEGKIVAVVNGRDEWGPRALGARSILADPRTAAMKDHLNSKIKFREEFRPFAPVVMAEHYADYFETLGMRESPYMLFTHRALKPEEVAASVHNDNTSRVQTVTREQNPYLYGILDAFRSITGVPVLINTSFNLRGEPIVSSPSDALKTFYASGIDALAIEDYLIEK